MKATKEIPEFTVLTGLVIEIRERRRKFPPESKEALAHKKVELQLRKALNCLGKGESPRKIKGLINEVCLAAIQLIELSK